MNVMVRNAARRQAGDAVYKILLILACVAMALAAFFPIYEWMTLYKAPESLPPAPKLSLEASAGVAKEATAAPKDAAAATTPAAPAAAAPTTVAPAPAKPAAPTTTVVPKPGA
jgi:hypothetical protein